ncbi:MAG: triosephosphate isomerase [Spirochaetales bacterium]|nr:triosephosphate isomerase [Spirochaetales bacterium]
MVEIFINLKRFDVPISMGGICPANNPESWIKSVITDTIKYGLGALPGVSLTYLLPESLLVTARNSITDIITNLTKNLSIGSQGVFRENIVKGGNFGAFTTNLPALAARNLGCTWAIIGHSEERRDKFEFIHGYQPGQNAAINNYINEIVNKEVICALDSGINVLLCVGETAEERGDGSFDVQKRNIDRVIKSQLKTGLKNTEKYLTDRKIVIGYEPRWAIGPGKTPPDARYIGYISELIKKTVKESYLFEPAVVYGGGLKEENAGEIASIKTIDGGLVALTRFSGRIGFEVDGLKIIIEKYLKGNGSTKK